ncbi:MAG: OmpH family outer membrane protein [Puniceicoccales bacterium]|jgi:Skp family chaperone for outer membrane proteins|nr:OmpH family outer membrane protein [Puniceicoccales bacterium]
MRKLLLVLTLSGLFVGALPAEQCRRENKQCDCENKQSSCCCNILTVDMPKIYNGYGKAERSKEKFQKAVEKAQGELRTMLEDGIKLAKELRDLQEKADSPALSESAREKHRKQIEELTEKIHKKEVEVNEFRQESDRQLSEKREEFVVRHVNEIKDVIRKVAKERGAVVVLNSAGLEVLYSVPDLDITQEVSVRLNAEK